MRQTLEGYLPQDREPGHSRKRLAGVIGAAEYTSTLSRTRRDLVTRLALASRSRSASRSSGNFNEMVRICFYGNTRQSGAQYRHMGFPCQ